MNENTDFIVLKDATSMLEDAILKLDYVAGAARVCAVAFDNQNAYASVPVQDTANAFFSIHSQLKEINQTISSVINIMIKDGNTKAHYGESQTG